MITKLTTTLAFKPFLDPLPAFTGWVFLIIPIVLAIAITYKTLKLNPPRNVFLESLKLSAIILTYLVTTAAILWFITEVLLV